MWWTVIAAETLIEAPHVQHPDNLPNKTIGLWLGTGSG
ncbi:FAD dependent oxidoreductase domain protein [Mycobacterium ulcerans str. Harvey]|uniref:FAD dependent oxidoreductase domain protein n=1 Tax=Mycobacterium ulcerans str. Harvey TaxID=1299332 RepID=A0ABN0QWX1_MYCUL|nr:FAD dependent oxidoreductase domain protein [Mycobacterium ulcerans str. Harvey]